MPTAPLVFVGDRHRGQSVDTPFNSGAIDPKGSVFRVAGASVTHVNKTAMCRPTRGRTDQHDTAFEWGDVPIGASGAGGLSMPRPRGRSPNQTSRGGRGVDKPNGHRHRKLRGSVARCRRMNTTRPLNGAMFRSGVPDRRRRERGIRRPRSSGGVAHPCPPRLLFRWGPAPWTKRGEPVNGGAIDPEWVGFSVAGVGFRCRGKTAICPGGAPAYSRRLSS